MTFWTQFRARRQDVLHKQQEPQSFQQTTDVSSRLAGVLVSISGVLLIFASAGFGANYALTQGAHHGPALAIFAIAMALGLEFAKPFAIEAAFTSFRQLALGRALAMAVLGFVAIAYSLTAELSLMASTRSDAAAARSKQQGAAANAKARYDRADRELASLAPARPAGELQALIDGVLANPKAGGCISLDGPFTREHCPKVAEWRAEIGRAEQRAKLEMAMREAEADQRKGQAVQEADAGAAALSTFLATLGIAIAPAALSQFMVLVGVLALEAGSSLAIVLVRSVDSQAARMADSLPVSAELSKIQVHEAVQKSPAPGLAAVPASVAAKSAANRGQRRGRPTQLGKDDAARRVLDSIKERGGRVDGSIRGLAVLINGKKSTVHTALMSLMAAGTIERTGTELVLRPSG